MSNSMFNSGVERVGESGLGLDNRGEQKDIAFSL